MEECLRILIRRRREITCDPSPPAPWPTTTPPMFRVPGRQYLLNMSG